MAVHLHRQLQLERTSPSTSRSSLRTESHSLSGFWCAAAPDPRPGARVFCVFRALSSHTPREPRRRRYAPPDPEPSIIETTPWRGHLPSEAVDDDDDDDQWGKFDSDGDQREFTVEPSPWAGAPRAAAPRWTDTDDDQWGQFHQFDERDADAASDADDDEPFREPRADAAPHHPLGADRTKVARPSGSMLSLLFARLRDVLLPWSLVYRVVTVGLSWCF